MSPTLRTASPAADDSVRKLIDEVFHRAGHESRVAVELASAHPDFDPGLALVGLDADAPAGWALFLPRAFRLRGAWVRLAALGPYGTHPRHRGRGVQRLLLETGLGALRDRGLRGAVTLGEPELLARFGFGAAFDHHAVRAPAEALPREPAAVWEGLAARHLTELAGLHEASYGDVAGTERRRPAAVDWAAVAPGAHTLVHEEGGAVRAYVRFRVREHVEVPECGVRAVADVPAVLALLARLAREHARPVVDAHLPPPHPVARALRRLGCTAEANDMGGSAALAVVDWPGLLRDTAPAWTRALEAGGARAVSLGVGGETWRLARGWRGLAVTPGRDRRAHVELSPTLAPGLVTGHLDFRDLLDHGPVEAPERLLRALFPGGAAAWTMAPVYELAVE